MDASGARRVSPGRSHIAVPQVSVGDKVKHRQVWVGLQVGLYRSGGDGMLPAQDTHQFTFASISADGLAHPLHHGGRPSHVGFQGRCGVDPYQGNIRIQLAIVIFKAIRSFYDCARSLAGAGTE